MRFLAGLLAFSSRPRFLLDGVVVVGSVVVTGRAGTPPSSRASISMALICWANGGKVSILVSEMEAGDVRAWEAMNPAVAGLESGSAVCKVSKISAANVRCSGEESRRAVPAAWSRSVGSGFDLWRQ